MLRTIRARLYLLMGVAAAAFVAVAVHAASVAWEARRDAELTANLEVARSMAGALRTWFDDVLHQSVSLGRAIAGGRIGTAEANRLLGDAVNEYAAVREFSWVGPDGRVAASSNASSVGMDLSDRDYLRRLRAGDDAFVSDLLQARLDGKPVVVVARAVRRPGGELLGAVVAVVAPDRLGVRALPFVREGDAALALVDRAGRLVFRTPAVDLDWAGREAFGVDPVIRAALAGEEATGAVRTPGTEDERLGAAVPVHGLGWAVRASRSKAEVIGPLRRELLVVLAASTLIAIAAVAASSLVGAGTVSALRRLERHALALFRGMRPARPLEGPEEIARLGRAYERMAEELLRTQRRFSTAFAEAPTALAVLDGETLRGRWANRAWLASLDEPFRSGGVDGARLDEFLPGATELGLLGCAEAIARGGPGHDAPEQRYDGFSRGPTWWRWSLRPIPGEGGHRDVLLLATEVTEQVRAREQLDADRRRLDTVLQTVPAGVFIADERGQLVQANDAARRLWSGRAPVRAVCEPRECRVRRAETGAPAEHGDWGIGRALRTGGTERGELLELERFDGTCATVLESASPIRDREGRVIGAVAALLDVTEQHGAVRHRDDVLHVLSQDLRTPLATVTLGAASLVRLGDGPDAGPRARRAATRIGAAARRMTRMVEDLLDLASLDEGRLPLRADRVDPNELLAAAAVEVRAVAGEKGLDVCLSATPGLPPVAADRDRLLQVIATVASNAVGATERGAVCLAAEGFGDVVVFRIRDAGPGVPADELPHLFDRFRRGTEIGWRAAGLGLAVSRALVEAHGGTIWAESAPGEGTTVSFTLPACGVAERDAELPAAAAS